MKKFIVVLFVVVAFGAVYAKVPASFKSLTEFKGDVFSMFYNKKYTQQCFITNNDIDGIIYYFKTKINCQVNEKYYIGFYPGPSDDYTIVIAVMNTSKKIIPILEVNAIKVYIPGNGYIYTEGHTDNMFNQRRKYKILGNKITEVKQPFYYVGKKTKTTMAITLWSDKSQTTKVAVLPKDYEVGVVLNSGSWYLLKTPFGLMGWHKIVSGSTRTSLECIFYNGD